MANQEHLDLLRQGAETWNQWREAHPEEPPNLREANLSGILVQETDQGDVVEVEMGDADLRNADLYGANLRETDLSGAQLFNANLSMANLRAANLSGANLVHTTSYKAKLIKATLYKAQLDEANFRNADLRGADLSEAACVQTNFREAKLQQSDLSGANLSAADLRKANLREANLSNANLSGADLSGADLRGANLSRALFIETNLSGADLTNCFVYGLSVWKVDLQGAKQESLIITPLYESTITVDNLEVAQFIYLLLNNQKIRDVIDTITSKVVLILGRFTPERKAVLDALRNELRKNNYSPVLFDFEKPASRDLTETVSTLAHLARFIIVDLTDPNSAPHEVAMVIPHTLVPVQPLLWQEPLMVDGKVVERREYPMFEDLRRRYHWVLPTFHYQNTAELLASLQAQIIAPAEQKARDLIQPK
jgi:uncharacterized protein YjbI with pentapeptide repeats